MAKAKKVTTLTGDEIARVQRAASSVWDECGFDVLQAIADDERKNINRVTVSRAVVIEIALDAGRTEEKLRRDKALPPDFLARWEALDYAQRIAVVKPAFGYARYGM